ncbi:hypothetical protein SODALDRAFT_324591 [Sodiomyces alkalinus F11]|uniref:DUF7719 domain-containing protein n=1 Tax=Sodiomyces alkalinus (strain CBS 110278 / VKM F-3762 / F11) TaxID=1314773 RepID=A0A3N2PUH8_SODAK|nr:hypothetical protein SODALDRAFT_324591 [Sodiomyces alkalinus F11]ROT38178.1 hypothetical protein SODALDRAFT_324591 [Sodiomyces alkalinus F11]
MGKMARQRKEKAANVPVKMAHPDRSGPTEKTLLEIAQERKLFEQADKDPRNKFRSQKTSGESSAEDDDEEEDEEPVLSPRAERVMESILWGVSLAMLHFTLDVLVQHQYGMEINWGDIVFRTGQASVVLLFLFYILHPHYSNPDLIPGLPRRYQDPARQVIFFATSVGAGCYLIYLTNTYGYLAVLKRAPTLGCLWVWAVIELPLVPAVGSLAVAGVFLWQGGYSITG